MDIWFLREWFRVTVEFTWLISAVAAIFVGMGLAFSVSPWFALLSVAGFLAATAYMAL